MAALSSDLVTELGTGLSIGYDRAFVPKSYFMRKNLSRIEPLQLPEISDPAHVGVCPVRTLQCYLHRTAALRQLG